MTDARKVQIGRIAAVGVGALAVLLGILFQNVNVSFLVGLAFAVAASANFPSLFMLLFWKRMTAKGIAASILVGVISSLTIILLSPSMYTLYGMDAASAPIPLDNPRHHHHSAELHRFGCGIPADAAGGRADYRRRGRDHFGTG